MPDNQSNNKTIAKNTLFLYLRMFISLGLSLITGRVVLRTLGVEDYGINAVVGGILGMFGVIQTSMIGATSRFITYELGRGDKKRLNDTFSTTLTIHIIIGIILVVLLETVGLWFLNNKLVIPENRMFAANMIYQFSVFSTMLGVTQTPYSSTMVAHEKLNVYAYFDILNMGLKLVIIYILLIGNMDKLILYGILTLCVSTFMLLLNRFYCIKHFEEAHYHFIWDKSLLKPIFSFSGWDLFANIASMSRGQGVTMLINMFFGVALNAASGISSSIRSVVGGFSTNIIMAARPQLVKRYADGDIHSMLQLMQNSIILCFTLMTYITIPVIFEMHFILNLWLGIIPEYACTFASLELVFCIIGSIQGIVVTIIQATGKIKRTSLFNGLMYIMVIPVTYISFKLKAPVWIPYAYNALTFFIGTLVNVALTTRYIHQLSLGFFLRRVIIPCFLLYIIASIPNIFIHNILNESLFRMFTSLLLTFIFTTLGGYYFVWEKELRRRIIYIVKEKLQFIRSRL